MASTSQSLEIGFRDRGRAEKAIAETRDALLRQGISPHLVATAMLYELFSGMITHLSPNSQEIIFEDMISFIERSRAVFDDFDPDRKE